MPSSSHTPPISFLLRVRSLAAVLLALLVICIYSLWPQPSKSDVVLRRITSTPETALNLNPSVSGDGQRIAFESTEDLSHAGGSSSFHAFQVDLNNPTAFVRMALSRAVAPGISQDGSRVAFASNSDPLGKNADGNSEIFLFDGGTLRQITETTPASESTRVQDGNFQPSLSDDGRFIAFASNRNLANQNSDNNLEAFVCDTSTQSFTQITNTTGVVGANSVKISGDGNHVANVSDTGTVTLPKRDLVIYARQTGAVQTIVADVNTVSLTLGRAISDDGTRVVYGLQTATNTTQVFVFDSRAGSSRQVTSLAARATDVPLNATISGDGKRIAFATRRNPLSTNSDGGVELFLFDLPTGVLSQVTAAPNTATGEVVSALSDDGGVAVFSFPRVISGAVSDNDFANDSEIYTTVLPPRASVGSLTISNAASMTNDPSSPKAIAPDSIVMAQGGSLALISQQAQPLADGSFPLSVGGTTVTVNGRPAQVLFVSPGEVVFVNPKETAVGPATITVTNSEGFPSTATIMVLSTAPGVFTFSGSGAGEGVILNADTLVAGPFDPTNDKLRLIIFATGVRGGSNITASIAGQGVNVESVQRSTELPGLDEVHVFLPAHFRGVGIVDVVVQADSQSSNASSLTLMGSSLRDVLINEVLADPPDGAAGDANHDGTRNAGQDEFIELVNTTTRDIDISGYDLLTRGASGTSIVRHTFANGTILSAGTACIVFGGGNPNPIDSVFGSALVFKASAGTLSLGNTGGVVSLRDASDLEVSTFTYGGSTGLPGDRSQSLTRAPDVTGGFALHQTAPNSGSRLYSAGNHLDGTPFIATPSIALIEVSPSSASIPVAAQQQFTARALTQDGQEVVDVIFKWSSGDTRIATVNQSGLATGIRAGIVQIFASARGVESVPASLTVADAPTPTPTPSPSPSPSAGPSPSPSASPTPTPPIVISEFRTRGPAGANDEFIELYNKGDSPVDISGWKIRGSNSAGSVANRLTLTSATIIPARGHFLAVNSNGYTGVPLPIKRTPAASRTMVE